MNVTKIILASGSPRRLALLQQMGITPTVQVPRINESLKPYETPRQFVCRMALEKAMTVIECDDTGSLVIGADTIVVSDNQVIGKPTCFDDAVSTLRLLSGKRHQVLTAVTVGNAASCFTRIVVSTVCFRKLSNVEIGAYCQTGEPFDKAGAYAIQGLAAMFIEEIQGSYSAIMGLPLYEVAALLAEAGVKVLDLDIKSRL
jgi:septum formation protein